MVREIRTGNRETETSGNYRSAFVKNVAPIYEMIKDRLVFPKYASPFHSFAAGQNDELAVMTYEWDESRNGYKYLLFNPNGTPRGIVYLNACYNDSRIFLIYGDEKLYYLREKSSGYKELVVQSIR